MKTKGLVKTKWLETTIPLVLNPGKEKQLYLRQAQAKIITFANQLLPFKKQASTALKFHHLVYNRFKYLGIHSQVQEAVQRRVYAARGVKSFTHLPMEFNFPRSGNLTQSLKGNAIVKISPLKKRIALPIVMNGGWRRVEEKSNQGWNSHSCILFKRNQIWVMHLIMRKTIPPPQEVEGTIGVDIGRKIMAAITLNHPSFPLVEQYLGKDLAWKQHQFFKRRKLLQRYASQGDKRARRALKRLRKKETNYVYTRCAQLAHEIVDLAVVTRSAIVLENLKNLQKIWTKQLMKRRKGGKQTRRSLTSWSYGLFHSILTRIATIHQIPVLYVNTHYTSQTCSRCGKRSKNSRKTRDLFRCVFCSFEVQSDRNASRNLSLLGKHSFANPFTSSFSSYLPIPSERRLLFSSVSRVKVRSTTLHGTVSSSLPVDGLECKNDV
jgi:IS605 OrfB family transposase